MRRRALVLWFSILSMLAAGVLSGVAVAVSPPPGTDTTTTTVETTTTTVVTTTIPPTTTHPPTTTAPKPPATTVPKPPFDPIRDAPVVKTPKAGQIALTFDDGPNATTTAQVLDVLKRKKVAATFFIASYQTAKYGSVVVRASREGHNIENHTVNHPFLTKLSTAMAYAELKSCSDRIFQLTGKRPTVFRPPYGAISPRIEAVGRSLGMTPEMWNVAPSTMTFTTSHLIATVTAQIGSRQRAGQGIIVLLHDGSGSRAAVVAALPAIIDYAKAHHLQFVKLG